MIRILFIHFLSFFVTILLFFNLTAELPGLSSDDPESEAKAPKGRTVRFPSRVVAGESDSGGGFISPEFIEIDDGGNLYIIDAHGPTLGKLSPDGRILWEISGREWGGDDFLLPRSIGVSSGLNLYLLDTGRRQIFKISDRGEILGVVSAGYLSDPRAITLTKTGKLVVYDGSTNEVSVIAPTGSLLWSFKPEGFRSRSHVGMVVLDEREICLYTRGAKTVRMYHFMGGLKRAWKPILPEGKSLKISSVDFDEEGRAFILDSAIPGLFIFDGLGNLLFDIREPLKEMGFKGPGEVRRWDRAVYIADVRGGKVFRVEIPLGTL